MESSTSPIHPLLASRWSPRAFADRDLDLETLGTLLQATRWSPSCYNDQPWSFVLARRDDDAYQNLLDCLVPQNRAWAATAPVLGLAVARLQFAHNGAPNRHAWYDLGLAVAQFIVQATALGLCVHQMAGFDTDAARQHCKVPNGFDPAVVFALGYQGDPSRLPAGVTEKNPAERARRNVSEFVFAGRWGVPFVGL
ncbi:MAG: nitroreductase [Gammaproteobacteria bacterium]|nr:nitroreductase [Gammaproteobacteria bacterium]